MKNFLKRNLLILIFLVVAIALMFLVVFSVVFLVLSCVIFGIIFLILAIRSKKKYNEIKDYSYQDDIIDVTKYDYDEDIYYIGDPEKRKKEVGKSALKKLSFSAPVIGLYMLSGGFFTIALMTVLRSLF